MLIKVHQSFLFYGLYTRLSYALWSTKDMYIHLVNIHNLYTYKIDVWNEKVYLRSYTFAVFCHFMLS